MSLITDEQLLSSSTVHDVMARLRTEGLHKTAGAARLEVPEVTAQAAVRALGAKLAYAHYRRARIQSGLASLETLQSPEGFKQANFLSNLLKRAPRAAAPAAHVAEEVTHIVPMGRRAAMSLGGAGAGDIPGAVAIPDYVRGARAAELPVAPFLRGGESPAAAAAGAVRSKARPTQAVSSGELPAMARLTPEGVSRAGVVSGGGSGVLRGEAAAAPAQSMSFGQGGGTSAEAPAMFNLSDLMSGKKQANADARALALMLGVPTALGAAHGYLSAPKGEGAAGTARGGALGFGTGAGLALGGVAGDVVGAPLLGALLGQHMGRESVRSELDGTRRPLISIGRLSEEDSDEAGAPLQGKQAGVSDELIGLSLMSLPLLGAGHHALNAEKGDMVNEGLRGAGAGLGGIVGGVAGGKLLPELAKHPSRRAALQTIGLMGGGLLGHDVAKRSLRGVFGHPEAEQKQANDLRGVEADLVAKLREAIQPVADGQTPEDADQSVNFAAENA